MLSNRLGTVNDFHWEFKPVLSYSKPHTFSTFFGKERKNAFNLSNQTKKNQTCKNWLLLYTSMIISGSENLEGWIRTRESQVGVRVFRVPVTTLKNNHTYLQL